MTTTYKFIFIATIFVITSTNRIFPADNQSPQTAQQHWDAKAIEIRWFETLHETNYPNPTKNGGDVPYLTYQENGGRIVKEGCDIGFHFINNRNPIMEICISDVLEYMNMEIYEQKSGDISDNIPIDLSKIQIKDTLFYLGINNILPNQKIQEKYSNSKYSVQVKYKILNENSERRALFIFKKLSIRILFEFSGKNWTDYLSGLLACAVESQINLAYISSFNTGVTIGYVPVIRFETRPTNFIDFILNNFNIGFAAPFQIGSTVNILGYGAGIGLFITKDNKSIFQIGITKTEKSNSNNTQYDDFIYFLGVDLPSLIYFITNL
jgi:hypothetical protein